MFLKTRTLPSFFCRISGIRLYTSALTPALLDHLEGVKTRHQMLAIKLQSPDLSHIELRTTGKLFSELEKIVTLAKDRTNAFETMLAYQSMEKEELAKGKDGMEMAALAKLEYEAAEEKLKGIEDKIYKTLIPKDSDDAANSTVLEVRAGTGGDEASLFASEIYKMYEKFAHLKGWKWEQLSLQTTEIGGFKEAQASVSGEDVFKLLKYEAGVHRVQRIPINDVKIQTSAASVIVLPEPEDVVIELKPGDLRIDVFRAGGAGGQSVNKTESAVRITHIPTGLVVSMQDERSQIQNRARAMKYLRAKVYELERRKQQSLRSELRSLAGGTGDRSDKIRTYNFPQDRVTDHRANFTINGVDRVMAGLNLDSILDALVIADEQQQMTNFLESLETAKSNVKKK